MITATIIKNMGINKTDAEIQTALDSIDQAALHANEIAKLSYEIWDKTSPINGCSAATILHRDDIPIGGVIYLIKKDGQVVYFQPHNPSQPGHVAMTAADIDAIAPAHINVIAQNVADGIVIQQVLAALSQ